MDKAGDNGNRPTPQEVLSALHETVPSLKIRLPQVTPAIEALAQQLNSIVLTEKDLSLGFQAMSGLKQYTGAVAAKVDMLADEISELPLLDPRRGRLHEQFRILSCALPFWHKMAATDFFQSASLKVY